MTNDTSANATAPVMLDEVCAPDGTSFTQMGLSALEIKALNLLMRGQRPTAVADAIGVHRGTLSRWMHLDGPFQRAYLQWQASAIMMTADQWKTLADDAVEAVRIGLKKGNANLGFRVLQSLGVLRITSNDDNALEAARSVRMTAGMVDFSEDIAAMNQAIAKDEATQKPQAAAQQKQAEQRATPAPQPSSAAARPAPRIVDPSKLNPGVSFKIPPQAPSPLRSSAASAVKEMTARSHPGAQQLRAGL